MTTLAEPGPEQVPRSKSLYDRDVYSWTLQQSQALRRRDLKAIDWENVIDEIESLGRDLQHAWEDYCARVIELFLKIEHWDDSSSARDPQHWAAAAQGCRLEMGTLVDENPGLESRYAAMFAEPARRRSCLAIHYPLTAQPPRADRCGRPVLRAA